MKFVDLSKQYNLYKKEIDEQIGEVLETTSFIKGPKVAELEAKLADFVGIKHCIGAASGTDALTVALMALGVRAGDEVIVPDFTFIATAETVAQLGAVPVFCDVDESFNIDVAKIESLITAKTKGIIAVSLFGQMPDLRKIGDIAKKNDIWLIEDAAQSFGAKRGGDISCSVADVSTTSFFPAKPFGAYGDGGAIFTDDDELAKLLRVIGNHGQSQRYVHTHVGINGRLDTLQAAVLLGKFPHLEEELALRGEVAQKYLAELKGCEGVRLPMVESGNHSVWAQFTVMVDNREDVRAKMQTVNIPTAVHYPIPLHNQKAFQDFAGDDKNFPVSVEFASKVISLPMHPFLEDDEIKKVCEALKEAVRR